MAWPIGAAITQTAIYTIDLYNRRVLRTDLTWQAEEICAVGGGAGASAPVPAAAPAVVTAAAPAAAANSDVPDKPDKSDRSDAPKPAARSAEQVCRSWLSMARNYRNAGLVAEARRCLNNVIREYPGTDWAARARNELAGL
jgi:hypothetical protein